MSDYKTKLVVGDQTFEIPNGVDVGFNSNGKTVWVSMLGAYYHLPKDVNEYNEQVKDIENNGPQ